MSISATENQLIPEEEAAFPEAHCIACIAELSIWTSVEDCMAAARCLEERPVSTDFFSTSLITPFDNSDQAQAVFMRCLKWLMAAYSPPESKIKMARLLDPAIEEKTADILMKTRFLPTTITAGSPELLARTAPAMVGSRAQRFFVISAASHVIELIQNPIRCLLDMITRSMETPEHLRALRREAKDKTGGAPTIVHQPYTDGPLFALVEAMCFYVHGLAIGPLGAETLSGVNRGFRSIEVIGRPPVDPAMLEVARRSCEAMFESIRS